LTIAGSDVLGILGVLGELSVQAVDDAQAKLMREYDALLLLPGLSIQKLLTMLRVQN
jgi:hypothetical protein